MKIEMNTIYHLPTQAHEDNFLKQADKQGITWWVVKTPATSKRYWESDRYCIKVTGCGIAYSQELCYSERNIHPIIEWKIGFSKADMQEGQAYKMKNGEMSTWRKDRDSGYKEDLTYVTLPEYNIMEVYPMVSEPIWKREEPKYRVKTELTKEQAEKLGLEFCEVIE